ncbi:autotransporter assembly complex protein TamA [Croceicoccus hydrothermalis]|uniref:autotransporter assembly complex protein TamA n=1 Tax=Croceicoccus hydrothermalis TaxID=2867964 RepID=UPI001EFA7B76|nr:BamA/TamA family outer membrane protein [Croceicoccus hydrothermalis]
MTGTHIGRFGKHVLASASFLAMAQVGAAAAQDAEVPYDRAGPQAADNTEADPLPVPAPPADVTLPEVETIISDEEFAESIPDLDAESDPALDMPLESIAEFERRLAEEQADAEPEMGADAPLGDPALADGDAVEEIGDAPVRDAELTAPLPPISAFEVEPVEFAEGEEDTEVTEVSYEIALNGIDEIDAETDVNIRDMFNDLSALRSDDRTANNVAQVSARLTEDSVLIERILASEGWFGASVETRIDRADVADGQPLTAVIDVTPGQRYEFADIVIDAEPTTPPDLIRENLPLSIGEPIVATRVQGAEANVAVALPHNGYPFAAVGQRDILLDAETGGGVYTLPVDTGPRAVFGGIETTGDLAFDAEHVAVLARFERGELYDSDMVDDLRQALVATGLFNTVTVEPQRTGEDAGTVEGGPAEYATVLVEQDAGPPRTIAGSAGYGTGQGARVEATWTHRNLFPPEGALIARAIAGTQEQGAGVTFRRSNAGRRDRTFEIAAEALRSDFDAFEALTGRLAARVNYDSTSIWQKPLTYAYGVQLLGTIEEDYDFDLGEVRRRTFGIAGLTGQVGLDSTKSLLDPTSGFRVTALIEPEASVQDSFDTYVRARLAASAYYPATDSIVLAARVAAGTIQGIDRFDLAPSRRFYAGGGGSVRGFGFHELGPKVEVPNPNFDPEDPDETANPFRFRPLGGLSFNELAVEARYRFGNFGVVGFVDAGQVYLDSVPDFSGLRYGVGLGGRFYTNFGPLRLDVAMPIDKQPGESSVAVYVSIGQAF